MYDSARETSTSLALQNKQTIMAAHTVAPIRLSKFCHRQRTMFDNLPKHAYVPGAGVRGTLVFQTVVSYPPTRSLPPSLVQLRIDISAGLGSDRKKSHNTL